MDDYIGMLREMAFEMYDEVWSTFERYGNKYPPSDLGRLLDNAAAMAAYRYLMREGLDFGIISEEWPSERRFSLPLLIIDPVDGTNNLSRGIGFSSISLAVALDNNLDGLVAGLILDLFSKDVYWVKRGGGAFRNNSRIHVNHPSGLKDLFVSVVIDRSIIRDPLIDLLSRVKVLRFFGSSALELSLLASGRLDAFIDLRGKLRIFDFAAGYLLVKEAGGYVYVLQKGVEGTSLSKVGGFTIIASSSDWFLEKVLNVTGL